ncbi:unnamed protein product [Blepharisma stoltei]|uniref:Uncharacterized protein n=1 Tax=Blepharisma stoltei TaxID=1481888 RepID=A0AAU9JBE3_9CILI|nr:unnamed protein product [Blepharisma stoltei]
MKQLWQGLRCLKPWTQKSCLMQKFEDSWELIELSGKLYYKHPWLEDEFYTLVKIEKDYDLRVWWYTQQFLRVKGRGIARTLRQ